jgi:hypothetical protein
VASAIQQFWVGCGLLLSTIVVLEIAWRRWAFRQEDWGLFLASAGACALVVCTGATIFAPFLKLLSIVVFNFF